MAWIKKGKAHNYNSREFRVTREHVRSRDAGLCFRCAYYGMAAHGQDVDHFVPVSRGGSDSPANCMLLCEPCHFDKTQRESRRLQGWRPKLNPATGWPMPEPDWLHLIAAANADHESKTSDFL